ncbi:poly(U)-specific endoribonuclease homolog isoform X2 [Harpegnathos saltator]|uniref:poly(U)-specific endoribonuclease homolog isoform X2 n=1 Tax=Harpegnathos saltator TaxID=610380 RepID=UPI000DBEE847|nr:poly(U)-specific endoribonuclease homolog isoform X2 [Harpegnathos saltator]
MMMKNRYFIIFVISLSLFIGAANPGLAINVGITRASLPTSLGTKIGLDIAGQRLNRPEIDGGQNYRNWAADLTAEGPLPRVPVQGFQGSTSGGLTGAGALPPRVPDPGLPPRIPVQGFQGPISGGLTGAGAPPPRVSDPGLPPRIPVQGFQGPTSGGLTGAGAPPPRVSDPGLPPRIPDPGPPPIVPVQGPQRSQGLTSGGQTQPSPLSAGSRSNPEVTNRPTASHVAANIPTQPNQPSNTGRIAGTSTSNDRSRPGTPSSPNSRESFADVADGGSRFASMGSPRQSEYPGQPSTSVSDTKTAGAAGDNQNKPGTSSSTASSSTSGKSKANVGGSRSSSPTELSEEPASSENKHKTTTKRPAEGPPEVPGPISLPNLVTGPSIMDLIPDKKKDNTDDDTDDDTKPKEKKVYSSNPIYSSNPTYSKENTVTDEDLEKLTETLYIKEMNNANQYITLNLQQKTTSGSPTDQAPQPLLTVSAEAFQIPTIQRVLSIFDNYQLDTHMDEYISPVQRQEEKLLIDTFLSTSVMSAAMRFLADKGFVQQDYYKYRDTLRGIWFNLFSRGQGKIGSAGFEQAFMAETRQADSGTEIYGLHNWIYFNAEETKRHIDYLGYMNKVDLGNKGSIVKVYVKFNGHDKPVTTMFVGTSPELEMALYTVCFYARPNGKCPVSLGGTKFNIVTYKFKYRGQDLIGTAYPEI